MENKLRVNNHYVSQCYLDFWAQNKKVWVYKKYIHTENSKVWNNVYIKHLCSLEYLYLTNDGKEYDDSLEKFFDANLENGYSNIIKKIIENGNIDLQDWELELLLKFICAQIYKTPKGKEEFENSINYQLKNINNTIYLNHNKTVNEVDGPSIVKLDIDCKRNYRNDNEEVVIIDKPNSKDLWLFSLERICNTIYKHLNIYNISLLMAPNEHYFFTTDSPVLNCELVDNELKKVNGIIYSEDKYIFLPISPQYIIMLSGKSYSELIELTDEQFRVIQKEICENAYNYIIMKEKDLIVETYVKSQINMNKCKEMDNYSVVNEKKYIEDKR